MLKLETLPVKSYFYLISYVGVLVSLIPRLCCEKQKKIGTNIDYDQVSSNKLKALLSEECNVKQIIALVNFFLKVAP